MQISSSDDLLSQYTDGEQIVGIGVLPNKISTYDRRLPFPQAHIQPGVLNCQFRKLEGSAKTQACRLSKHRFLILFAGLSLWWRFYKFSQWNSSSLGASLPLPRPLRSLKQLNNSV
jgi:hypothetical protein